MVITAMGWINPRKWSARLARGISTRAAVGGRSRGNQCCRLDPQRKGEMAAMHGGSTEWRSPSDSMMNSVWSATQIHGRDFEALGREW
jgi:hypothetical protein